MHYTLILFVALSSCAATAPRIETPDGAFLIQWDADDCYRRPPYSETDASGRVVVFAEPVCVPGVHVITTPSGEIPQPETRDTVLRAYEQFCAPKDVAHPPTWARDRWIAGGCGR